jgi:excisionase family DNA binding protein
MPTRKFISRQEVSDLYDVSIRTVDRWITDGTIKAVKVGRVVRVVVASLPGVE